MAVAMLESGTPPRAGARRPLRRARAVAHAPRPVSWRRRRRRISPQENAERTLGGAGGRARAHVPTCARPAPPPQHARRKQIWRDGLTKGRRRARAHTRMHALHARPRARPHTHYWAALAPTTPPARARHCSLAPRSHGGRPCSPAPLFPPGRRAPRPPEAPRRPRAPPPTPPFALKSPVRAGTRPGEPFATRAAGAARRPLLFCFPGRRGPGPRASICRSTACSAPRARAPHAPSARGLCARARAAAARPSRSVSMYVPSTPCPPGPPSAPPPKARPVSPAGPGLCKCSVRPAAAYLKRPFATHSGSNPYTKRKLGFEETLHSSGVVRAPLCPRRARPCPARPAPTRFRTAHIRCFVWSAPKERGGPPRPRLSIAPPVPVLKPAEREELPAAPPAPPARNASQTALAPLPRGERLAWRGAPPRRCPPPARPATPNPCGRVDANTRRRAARQHPAPLARIKETLVEQAAVAACVPTAAP
ncbi:hypothetical protein Rsub_02737 [Raphidocelis subcapitata]|uniref:Uncharacterized protein n=1 Tax=Raphidocelis subcapitata TaxID=307507 RepID=A0A2V0NRT1_9CHLO|nr:hypothetical protein Rsub_02737 [Raphidocelis subcapitata]|eukprot:GBF90029.1 hypothetical protein Rsub_02737 [Raphidocelis subcapitata]